MELTKGSPERTALGEVMQPAAELPAPSGLVRPDFARSPVARRRGVPVHFGAAWPGAPSSRRRHRGHRLRLKQTTAVLILPSMLLIGMFTYYPAVKSLIGGFYSWNGFSPPQYVGIAQFREYLTSPTFGTEAKNVLLLVLGWLLITLVAQFAAAEIVAHLPGRLGSVSKYLFALPIVLPPVVLIDVWAYMFNPTDGLIDKIFNAFGLAGPNWLGNEHLVLVSILLIGFPWISNLGFLIFLGGVQNLPSEVLEASALDGATGLKRWLFVDAPLLVPQFRVAFILAGLYMAQNFVPILLLTNGGPGNATMVPGLDMYESAFQNDQYGYGMAIGTLLFVAMLLFTLFVMRLLRPRT
ncbi:MAG: carbohydrate ABC transporter permease [Acidimicrobiales bacterium]